MSNHIQSWTKRIVVGSAVMLFGTGALVGLATAPASAHGSMNTPASRSYTCYYNYSQSWGKPSANPMCAQMWDDTANNPLYDWQSIADGSADSKTESRVPDGKLCSNNNPKFTSVDVASDKWPAAPFNPDSDGLYSFHWTATAPHATKYYRIYLSNSTYDPTQPLKWSNLDKVYESGSSAAAANVDFRIALPARTGRQMIYTVWQRSDSPEAFTSCSDVMMGATSGASPSPTTSTPSPSPSTSTASPSPSTSTAPSAGAAVKLKFTASEWGGGTGRGESVDVKNVGTVAVNSWSVKVPWPSNVSSVWNGVGKASGGSLSVANPAWGGTIPLGASTNFGFNDYTPTTPAPQSCTAIVNGAAAACSIEGVAATTASPSPTQSSASPSPTTSSASPSPSTSTASPSPSTSTGSKPYVMAPYVDMGLWPPPSLTSMKNATGVSAYTAAFLTSPGAGSCTPAWAGSPVLTLDSTDSQAVAINKSITDLQAAGGQVIVSLGGANGTEIASTCTNVTSLKNAYKTVVNKLNLTTIDFDIEGANQSDHAANVRRSQAMKMLQDEMSVAGRPLKTIVTLPVLETGLVSEGMAVINDIVTGGMKVDVVNVMAMDYGHNQPDMGQAAISAATNAAKQISVLYPTLTDAQRISKIGVTPMIGVNDTGVGETFSLANTTVLRDWAKTNNLAYLSFWSMARDTPCPNNGAYASYNCSGTSNPTWSYATAFNS